MAIQYVSVSSDPPAADFGSEGDIYYQNADDGIHVWQRVSEVWQDVGTLEAGATANYYQPVQF